MRRIENYLLNRNHGGAIDLGVIYEYNEQLTLAASLVNLGFIRWGSNVHRFDASGSTYFSGFDMRAYASSGGSTDFLEALGDSIMEAFHFETSSRPYWTMLTTRLYTGASYRLYPKLKLSGLVRTEIENEY